MKTQQVSVDYWAMGKAMLTYAALTAMGWLMLRLFNTIFTLPRRMRDQQENIQKTLQDLQKRFPDLNITEEDLKNAEQELENFVKEEEQKEKEKERAKTSEKSEEVPEQRQIEDITENKKSL